MSFHRANCCSADSIALDCLLKASCSADTSLDLTSSCDNEECVASEEIEPYTLLVICFAPFGPVSFPS